MPDPRPPAAETDRAEAPPEAPAIVVLAKLDSGGALARALPAWTALPGEKTDFRTAEDMQDIFDGLLDEVEERLPGTELSDASVYGFVRGLRKLAVLALSAQPMPRGRAEALLGAIAPERKAGAGFEVESVADGAKPLSKESPIESMPGLARALAEVDAATEARHNERRRASEERWRREDELKAKNQAAEARLAALAAKRKLLSDLASLDPEKAPLAIFAARSRYALPGYVGSTVGFGDEAFDPASMVISHAVAVPLADLMGEGWDSRAKLRAEDLRSLAGRAERRAVDAMAEAGPDAGIDSIGSAVCLPIAGRLVVALEALCSKTMKFAESDLPVTGERSRELARIHAASLATMGSRSAFGAGHFASGLDPANSPAAIAEAALLTDEAFGTGVLAMDIDLVARKAQPPAPGSGSATRI